MARRRAPRTRSPRRAARGARAERIAEAAIAHEGRVVPSAPGKVELTLTVSLDRAQAERLTAKAIREGKNLEALAADILGAAPTE